MFLGYLVYISFKIPFPRRFFAGTTNTTGTAEQFLDRESRRRKLLWRGGGGLRNLNKHIVESLKDNASAR